MGDGGVFRDRAGNGVRAPYPRGREACGQERARLRLGRSDRAAVRRVTREERQQAREYARLPWIVFCDRGIPWTQWRTRADAREYVGWLRKIWGTMPARIERS